MTRYVNLIFQGGGVKGLSYAGALSRMPKDVSVRVVGGSSAGAIAAALIACDYDPRNLRAVLETLDVGALLGPEGTKTLADLRALIAEIAELASEFSSDNMPLAKAAYFVFKKRKVLRQYFEQLSTDWGFFSTAALKDWLEEKTGGKRFRQISTEDLRIVASNVSTAEFQPYSKGETPTAFIHEAALASSSIPYFFIPARESGYLVDGGMLSNFPMLYFEREPYPTVGFRLRPLAPTSTRIDGFAQYSQQLLDTVLDAHDKVRPRPEHFHEESIYLPKSISAIDFDLKPEQKEELFQLGVAAGGRVDWKLFSSPTPLLTGLDPKPDKVVTRVLANGQVLSDALQAADIRPKVLIDEADFKVTLEPDWSVSYEIVHRYRVEGERVYMGGFANLTFLTDTLDLARTSLVDFNWDLLETTNGKVFHLPRFPVTNETLKRKFVYLFIPPVCAADGVRTFVNRWRIPVEMAATLGRGNPDTLGYSRAPRADEHRLNLKMLVLVADSLGDVKLTPTDGNHIGLKKLDEKAYLHGAAYTQWTAGTADFITLPGNVEFNINVSPNGG